MNNNVDTKIMTGRMITSAVAALMLLAPASMAQTTAEEAPAETATEAPAATEAEAAPETATETEAEAPAADATVPAADPNFPVASADDGGEVKDGQQYIKETFDDWQVRCIKGSEDTSCGLYQLLTDEQGNSVAEFNLVALPAGGQAAGGVTFVSPLGTLLTAQVSMRVDSGQAKRYPYSWCEQSGCVSRFGLTDGEVTALKRGNKATIVIASVAAADKPITLNLSLKGVTAAWDSISK